jgi:hypothetical protein
MRACRGGNSRCARYFCIFHKLKTSARRAPEMGGMTFFRAPPVIAARGFLRRSLAIYLADINIITSMELATTIIDATIAAGDSPAITRQLRSDLATARAIC